MSKIGNAIAKIGDALDPSDRIAGEAAEAALDKLQTFIARYPVLEGALKGRKVEGNLSFSFQLQIVEAAALDHKEP